jgi:hypothetical protein
MIAYRDLGAMSVLLIAAPLAAVHMMSVFAARGVGATAVGARAEPRGVHQARAA